MESEHNQEGAQAQNEGDQSRENQNQQEGEEEEEGECPFCLFMKSGPCGKEFQEWENCVQEAEKEAKEEVVVRCRSITQVLMKCMESSQDYYGVVLQAGEKLQQSGDGEDKHPNEEHTEGKQQKEDEQASSGIQVHVQVDDTNKMAA